MGIFGKKNRDDEYVVTLKNGKVLTIYACRANFDPNENVVWFYSSNLNILPTKVPFDDIVSVESNGKVVSIPMMIVGAVGGGFAGSAVAMIMKNIFGCTIKNALLAKAFMVVFIGGTALVVGCAVGNELADQAEDFVNKGIYVIGKLKDLWNNNKLDNE